MRASFSTASTTALTAGISSRPAAAFPKASPASGATTTPASWPCSFSAWRTGATCGSFCDLMKQKPPVIRVVVLGGGFGGIAFCKELDDPRFAITLIDRQNHHLFQPLLYQVATGGLSPAEIAQPIRSSLRKQENVTVLMENVQGIDLPGRVVQLEARSLGYDVLVIALGARTGYFGHDEWEEHAPGLKTLEDA